MCEAIVLVMMHVHVMNHCWQCTFIPITKVWEKIT